MEKFPNLIILQLEATLAPANKHTRTQTDRNYKTLDRLDTSNPGWLKRQMRAAISVAGRGNYSGDRTALGV